MQKIPVIIGQTISLLTILKEVETPPNATRKVFCRCVCGIEKEMGYESLRMRKTKSCGCLKRNYLGDAKRTHGLSNTLLYQKWGGIKDRCFNSNAPNYKYYGGRGISICKDWETDYTAFHKWAMDNGYQKGLTIERIDFNGNYEPSNCKWATWKEQQNNTSRTRFVKYKGQTKSLMLWCEELDLEYGTIKARLKLGWSIEKQLETKSSRSIKITNRPVTVEGETKNFKEMCKKYNIATSTVFNRINKGMSIQKAFLTPARPKKKNK